MKEDKITEEQIERWIKNKNKDDIKHKINPIYSIKTPYWNQALGLRQSYFAGYGETLPQVHFQTFGAGFSGLPMELGGQITGGSSRVTGRPME